MSAHPILSADVPPEPAPGSVVVTVNTRRAFQRIGDDGSSWYGPPVLEALSFGGVWTTWTELLSKGPVWLVWTPEMAPRKASR